MRLFISLNFDANTVESLCNLQSLLRDNGVEGNFTKPQNLHMTLAFIGEYGKPDDVLDVIEEVPFRYIPICFSDVYVHREMVLVSIAHNQGLESYFILAFPNACAPSARNHGKTVLRNEAGILYYSSMIYFLIFA